MITMQRAKADHSTCDLELTSVEARKYSVASAILTACDPNRTSFEADVSQTLATRMQRSTRHVNAIFVPTKLYPFRPQASGLDTKTNAAGNYTVGTQVQDLVDALRAQMRVAQLGATFLGGLAFNATFPGELSSVTAAWVPENGGTDTTETTAIFQNVTATPHPMQSSTSISRQLLQQAATSGDLEQRIRRDLMRAHAQLLDAAAICGSGSSGSPRGLLSMSELSILSLGASGAAPSYNSMCDLEYAVAAANLPDDGLGTLTTPGVRRVLRKSYVNGVGSLPVWSNNAVLDHAAVITTSVPSNLSKGSANGTLSGIIFGRWPELIVCEWGIVELVVDPFRLKKQGMVEVTSFSMVDVVCPRPSAFAVNLDAVTS